MNEVIVIIILILVNGIFSMSEIAVISARKSSLSTDVKKGSKAADTALKLANQPEKFLSTVQIGITLIGILTGIYSGAKLADSFTEILVDWNVPKTYAPAISQTTIVIVVTYLTILFGELVPKRLGLSSAERIAKIIARPMQLLSIIAAPFVWILSRSTSFIFNMLGVSDSGNKITEEEIKSIIKEGTEEGEVQEVEQDIMERALLLGDLNVYSLMTYRSDITAIDINMSSEEIREVVKNNLYEMYPVIDKTFDDVKGVISLKTLFLNFDNKNFCVKDYIETATFFHENMSVYSALEQMKVKRINQALVCDEFGSCQGIITLRDILEGLVGSIEDTQEEPDIIKRSDSDSWLVDGRCPFYDFLCYFEKEEYYDPEESNYSTISGLILDILDRIPMSGEKVQWKEFNMEIVDMDGARIDKVLVTISHDENKEEEEKK